ncbi:GNAT family N-acetyltransferase [Isoptericola aurantiacus]|uniref:GNAT family N-acetyltransferase n=1 Tax=Isoptericola aurantiacus TaxID=3377839 RepID=UPI00383A35AF
MTLPVPLVDGVTLRLLRPDDGPALAAAYARNREHLAPWEPVRPDAFWTAARQTAQVGVALSEHAAGRGCPLVLDDDGAIVGRLNVSDVVGGAFLNGHLGYWVDAARTGRGLMSAAVRAAVDLARDDLGLHRLQAATLPHNAASQRVLDRAGFTRIGVASRYLRIAGEWQDHVLFQRILDDPPTSTG